MNDQPLMMHGSLRPGAAALSEMDMVSARDDASVSPHQALGNLPGADVLIVIPSLNEEAHLAKVIHTLREDPGTAGAMIVVADGGSRDRTVAIVDGITAEDPRVRAIPSPGPLGISASINKAVRLHGAGRRWLVRIDAHAAYPENYASRLVATALERGADCVVTPMVTRGDSCFQQAAAAAQNSLLGTGGAAHRLTGRGGWVDHGHHALMRLDAFTAVGGYDETFSHNEDAELDHRLRQAGNRIWLEDSLALYYFPRRSTKALYRQYYWYGRGRAKTVARHGGKRKLRQTAPLAIAPAVLLLLLTPWFWPAGLPAACWASACLLYGLVRGRNGERCAMLAGYPAMVMHLAWSLGYWRQLLGGPAPGAFHSSLGVPAHSAG
jgi:succinoglycan biosynthesis protein ExoA